MENYIIWMSVQLGHLGSYQRGHLGHLGHLGQLGHLGCYHLGHLGHLRQFCHLDHLGHLGSYHLGHLGCYKAIKPTISPQAWRSVQLLRCQNGWR